MRSVGHPGRVATRTVQRLGRRVVNLSLAGQFGARRTPVGLATGPRDRACRPSPCRRGPVLRPVPLWPVPLWPRSLLRPNCARDRVSTCERRLVTLALDLLQPLAQGFAPGLQPGPFSIRRDAIVLRLRVSTPMAARSVSRRSTSERRCNASFDTRRKSSASARAASSAFRARPHCAFQYRASRCAWTFSRLSRSACPSTASARRSSSS